MPQIYELPTLNESSSGMLGLLRWSNTAADGILFPLVLLVIWIIIFVSSLNTVSASRAWVFASVIGSILAVMLAVLNLLAPDYMYGLFVMAAIGFVWLKLEG